MPVTLAPILTTIANLNTTISIPSSSTPFEGLPLIPSEDYLSTPSDMSISRAVRKVFLAPEKAEGAGARVRRAIGVPQLRNFSPFLMMDYFKASEGAGFPDHPHRGFETITYMLTGATDHEDFTGGRGTIEEGDLHENGVAPSGIQLWVDLPEKLKDCDPRYRDLKAAEIPQIDVDDGKVHIKVISGQSHGTDSVKDLAYTPVWYFDVEIKPGGKLTQTLPKGWNSFAYMIDGKAKFGVGNVTAAEKYNMVVFEQEGDEVHAEVDASATENGHFILVAGIPLDQQIVQYGPFVQTSQDKIYKAIMDFQTQSNGFERARGWESEIGKNFIH
ncbi:hypothetical protein DH86_00001429 [Scytalidium sp. 3C]|nr:hypothetical protein DH86_00001429 [Scytalidium sp. 3C]